MKELLGSVTGFVLAALVLLLTSLQSANADSRVDRQIGTLGLPCNQQNVVRIALLKAVYDQPVFNRVRIFEQDHIIASFRPESYLTVSQSYPQHFAPEDQQQDASKQYPESFTVIFASRQNEREAHYSQILVSCDVERDLVESASIVGQWRDRR